MTKISRGKQKHTKNKHRKRCAVCFFYWKILQ